MVRWGRYTVLLLAALIIMSGFFFAQSACAQESSAVRIIPVEEVKAEEGEGTHMITLEEVEEARVMTEERLYGLLCLWGVIIIAIVLIRLQVRDDEKLYKEGYYSRDLE